MFSWLVNGDHTIKEPGSSISQPCEFNWVSLICSSFNFVLAWTSPLYVYTQMAHAPEKAPKLKRRQSVCLTVIFLQKFNFQKIHTQANNYRGTWGGWRKWWRSSSRAQMKKKPEHIITSANGRNLTNKTLWMELPEFSNQIFLGPSQYFGRFYLKWLSSILKMKNKLTCQCCPAALNLLEPAIFSI